MACKQFSNTLELFRHNETISISSCLQWRCLSNAPIPTKILQLSFLYLLNYCLPKPSRVRSPALLLFAFSCPSGYCWPLRNNAEKISIYVLSNIKLRLSQGHNFALKLRIPQNSREVRRSWELSPHFLRYTFCITSYSVLKPRS